MDSEISTLALSNELLLAHITRQTESDAEALMESLSTYRQAVDTPYHQPYEAVRQVIMAHDRTLSALSRNPDVMGQAEGASLLAILANISPELYNILTEEITEKNADALFAKNFGENITPENFASLSWIARHYGLEFSDVQKYLGMFQNNFSDNASVYVDNISTGLVTDHEDGLEAYKITRVPGKDYTKHLNFWDLLYNGDNNFVIRGSFKKNGRGFTIRKSKVGTTNNSKPIGYLSSPTNANTVYQSGVLSPLTADELKKRATIFVYNRGGNGQIGGTAVFTFESYPLSIFALKLNKAIRLCLASGLSPNELQTIVYSDNAQGVINDSVLTKVFY
ncbi:neuraminidase-like domain-containing protein, partial [Xenorhabdus bovienii]